MPDILTPEIEILDSESRTVNNPSIPGNAPDDAAKPAETKPDETPVTDEAGNEESAPLNNAETHGDEDSTDAQPKKKGVQKRIDELTRQRYEAENAANLARLEDDHWKRQVETKQTEQTPAKNSDAHAPRFEDFESYDDYVSALAEYKADKRINEIKSKDEQQKKAQEINQLQETFNKKADETRKKYDDFDAVAMGQHVIYTPATARLVIESDAGPELAYYLGKNPDVAKNLAQMPPIAAAKEIGRLEEKLLNVKPLAKKTTGAPPPISPVGANDNIKKDINQMSTAEYIKHRRAQMKNNRR